MTRPPSRAIRSVVARPMPEAAPVTMTVLSLKRPAMICSVKGMIFICGVDCSLIFCSLKKLEA